MITGIYNKYGYSIFSDGDELYSAGNNQWDSEPGQSLTPGSKGALPLKTLRKYCQQTALDIAEERSESFGGISNGQD